MARGVSFDVDDSDLRRLIVDLSEAPLRAQFGSRKTLQEKVGPLLKAEMEKDAVDARRSHPTSIPKLPRAVSFDMRAQYELEAGYRPDAGNHARLAHILWYGSVNNAPVGDHTAALRRTARPAESMLAEMAEKAVLGDEGAGGRR